MSSCSRARAKRAEGRGRPGVILRTRWKELALALISWVAVGVPITIGAAVAETPPTKTPAPQSYAAHCQGCHGPDLGGAVGPSTGPALRGAAFVAKWKAAGPGALLAYIKATMPANQPGGQDAPTYAAIADFVAAKSDLPPESTASVPGSAGRGVAGNRKDDRRSRLGRHS